MEEKQKMHQTPDYDSKNVLQNAPDIRIEG